MARNNYVSPIGAGIGKVFVQSGGPVINVFAEPQWSIADHGAGQSELQVYAGINFQFPLAKRNP